MEIKPPASDLYSAIARNVSATAENNLPTKTPTDWKVSQLIQAVITRLTDKQIFLDIQGVKANTPKPANLDIQTGDILKLQIEQLRPMPQFRIVGLQKAADNTLIAQALNTLLSQKTSTAPLLKDISYVASRPSLRPSPLAAEVNAAVRNIFQQLPSPFNLKTAAQLKTHLLHSGGFTESNIRNQMFSATPNLGTNKIPRITPQVSANIKSTLELDLGAQLHRLANLIRTQLVEPQTTSPLTNHKAPLQSPVQTTVNKTMLQQATPRTQGGTQVEQPGLQNISQREEAMQTFLRQVESSLNHMQQTQLQSLNESQAGRPLWLMELPIKDGQDIDLFELRISEEESSQEEEAKKTWNVTLQFDLTGLGKVKAHIKMQNDFISTQFISEKPETLALFKDNLDFLKNRLSYNGLNVGKLDCIHANLSSNHSSETTKRLDERT